VTRAQAGKGAMLPHGVRRLPDAANDSGTTITLSKDVAKGRRLPPSA
jgi:hypothetical protein